MLAHFKGRRDRIVETAELRLARAGEIQRSAVVHGGSDDRQPSVMLLAAPKPLYLRTGSPWS